MVEAVHSSLRPTCLRRYPAAWACVTRSPKVSQATASRGVSLVTGLRVGRSGLDFKQSSFGLATRVLRGHGSLTSSFPASPACSGPPYLSVVGKPDDPGSTPKSLLFVKGIQHQIARRTTASQAALLAGSGPAASSRLKVSAIRRKTSSQWPKVV